MEAGGFDSETTGTWAGKLPASLLPPAPPPTHVHTSPKASPVKRPAEESPSKVIAYVVYTSVKPRT